MEIVILRLGHRPERDKRTTTHLGLVGRALGARGMLLAANDKGVERSVREVTKRWGGDFFVQSGVKWRAELRAWKQKGGKVCHLTMYGENLPDVISEVREGVREGVQEGVREEVQEEVQEEVREEGRESVQEEARVLVVVGAEKVPYEVFEAADWNVAVSNQPHSEVAALALFLDYLQEGRELRAKFEGAELEVVPKRRGKAVKRLFL